MPLDFQRGKGKPNNTEWTVPLMCVPRKPQNRSWNSPTLTVLHSTTAAAAKLPQSCPPLCHPIDGSPPDSPIPGILQAKTLEWVAITILQFNIDLLWQMKQDPKWTLMPEAFQSFGWGNPNPPWMFIGRTVAEAEAPILWPPDGKSQLTGKDLDAGKG